MAHKNNIISDRPIRAAVVGAGHIARQHLACLTQIKNVEVAGVCDLSRSIAEFVSGRFNVKQFFTSHKEMFRSVKPDTVHVTTPVSSHFQICKDAMEVGIHVIVEKPAAMNYPEFLALKQMASDKGLIFIEDYNCVFDPLVQKIISWVCLGEFGEITHADVSMCLDILTKGGPFVDPDAPHPSVRLEGGAIADFLPHLASLSHAFTGPHESVRTIWQKRALGHSLPADEFRALVRTKKATASLSFSAHSKPDEFFIRVYGTKMNAEAHFYEPRLTVSKVRPGPKVLTPFFNALEEARSIRGSAFKGLVRKVSGGPGTYEGLWRLVEKVYESLRTGSEPPVSMDQMDEVNRLVHDLTKKEFYL